MCTLLQRCTCAAPCGLLPGLQAGVAFALPPASLLLPLAAPSLLLLPLATLAHPPPADAPSMPTDPGNCHRHRRARADRGFVPGLQPRLPGRGAAAGAAALAGRQPAGVGQGAAVGHVHAAHTHAGARGGLGSHCGAVDEGCSAGAAWTCCCRCCCYSPAVLAATTTTCKLGTPGASTGRLHAQHQPPSVSPLFTRRLGAAHRRTTGRSQSTCGLQTPWTR